jgi:hypothetical protein
VSSGETTRRDDMSDENETVKVEITQENAINLLEAADELDLDPSVVATTSFGWFEVPKEVADKAGVTVIEEEDEGAEPEEALDGKSPAPTKDEEGNLVPATEGADPIAKGGPEKDASTEKGSAPASKSAAESKTSAAKSKE